VETECYRGVCLADGEIKMWPGIVLIVSFGIGIFLIILSMIEDTFTKKYDCFF
jgi:hypothetical protein